MNTKYKDLIEQTFDFPQEEFQTENGNLLFHNIDLAKLVEQYGTPLKFTYLPKITENINRAKNWFNNAIKKYDYKILDTIIQSKDSTFMIYYKPKKANEDIGLEGVLYIHSKQYALEKGKARHLNSNHYLLEINHSKFHYFSYKS